MGSITPPYFRQLPKAEEDKFVNLSDTAIKRINSLEAMLKREVTSWNTPPEGMNIEEWRDLKEPSDWHYQIKDSDKRRHAINRISNILNKDGSISQDGLQAYRNEISGLITGFAGRDHNIIMLLAYAAEKQRYPEIVGRLQAIQERVMNKIPQGDVREIMNNMPVEILNDYSAEIAKNLRDVDFRLNSIADELGIPQKHREYHTFNYENIDNFPEE
jgi:hypothetical protein